MLIKSSLISQASGSLAGATAARNSFGQYLRARVKGVNPKTFLQEGVRSILALVVTAWRGLSDVERASWDTAAANTPVRNRLGDIIHLKGNQAFTSAMVPRLQAGLLTVGSAPNPFIRDGLTAPTTSAIAANPDFKVTPAPESWLATGGTMAVYVGQEVADTVNYYNGPWRYAGNVTTSGTTTLTNPYGSAYNSGAKTFCEVRVLNTDGSMTGRYRQSTVAA